MNTITMPFAIGQTLWRPRTTPEQVTVTCPACLGTGVIRFFYGEEIETMHCEACTLGSGTRPSGRITEWQHTPAVTPFTIAAVVSLHQDQWQVQSDQGETAYVCDLYPTEAEALAVSVTQCEAAQQRNMESRQHKRRSKARASWSARYHRERIVDCERQIAWHRSKLSVSTEPSK